LVQGTVEKAARLRGGSKAFAVDEDGDEVMRDPWRSAADALLNAAMALGAPHLVDEDAAGVLTGAWNSVFDS
jgi:hypothetical protein